MVNKSDLPEVEKVSCSICRKEVPLSEAKTPEAVDYVTHFCGLECYEQWKQQSERSGKQNAKAAK
jgi:hypothetical protein